MKPEAEIHCPRCGYRPRAEDRWACVPSCGTVWNTFWTRGVCPGCGVKWPKTACPACERWSPHEAWYHHPDGADGEASERAEAAPGKVGA